jgi:gliding motility-associated-like protein
MVLAAGVSKAQLQVDAGLTPVQLVEGVLVGSCVSISNISFNGVLDPNTARPGTASFANGATTNLGLGSGIILSTGPANQIANAGSFQQSSALTPNYTVDPDLQSITGIALNNAAVLEFDFIPNGDSISFRYVFGSEEYPEFVCSQFNDAFGFFLSGPGIAGPYTNNAINIALVPGSTTAVAINNVNNGLNNNPNDPTCPSENPQYYINNANGTTICYDGLTTVLTARASVQCNQVYHIKLAIADASDQIYDSGVFLEAGSFSSVPFVPELTPGPAIVGNTILESCLPLSMDIQRTSCDLDVPETVYLSYGGVAEMGVDITPSFPDSLVFGPGESIIPIPFSAPVDADGPETFTIDLQTIDCNGQTVVSTFEFIIDRLPDLQLAGSTNAIACGDDLLLAPTVTGGFGQYEYLWSTNETTPSITVSPTAPTTYTLTVTDLCDETISATYQVDLSPPPPLNMSIIGSDELLEGCQTGQVNIIRPQGSLGDITVTLSGSGTATAGQDYTLPPSIVIPQDLFNLIIDVPTDQDELIEGNETATITGSYTNACAQTVTATVEFVIVDVEPLRVTANDIAADCGPDSLLVLATVTGGVAPFEYQWSNGEIGAGILVPLQDDGQVTVNVTDACGREAAATSTISIDCEIIIPNVFSPNGDGRNDRWEIDGLGNRNNTVRVFNRWGQLVLDSKNYRNTWTGGDAPDGTYYYEVIVTGKGDPYTGHVTILRNGW